MLEVKNVFLSYNKDYFTLNDISFYLNNNEQLTIVGNQDSGKSSIARLLVGLDKPNKGTISFNDINIEKIDFKNDIELGYIPTDFAFMNRKSIQKNLEYVLKIRKLNKDTMLVKVANALVNYDLEIIKNKKINQLNYYEKLKVAIARLSLRNIDFFVIDDVFSKLDGREKSEICSILKKLIKQNNASALILCSDLETAEILGYNKMKLNYGTLENLK